tara:strand:+ start:1399 stop:2337 length:939 start_codon:yes stop_codon:yes gene_type:complete
MATNRNEDRTTGMPKSGPTVADSANSAAAVAAATQQPPPTMPPGAGPSSAQADVPDFLRFASPTEWVDLPSKGKFYPEGHPFHNKEQIEIKYMTAKEEDILASKSLLKKGIAIDRLIKSVCVDRVNIGSLLTGDKNAIMVAARVTGYGTDYSVNLQCPVCAARNENYNWDLSEVAPQQPDMEWLEKHGYKPTPRGYQITLPKTGARVSVRFLNGDDEEKLDKLQSNRKKANLGESRMTDQFRQMIVEISGHSDRTLISKFAESMPAGDARVLRKSYAEAKPDVDMSINYVCGECLSESEVDMPMTAEFFWPE